MKYAMNDESVEMATTDRFPTLGSPKMVKILAAVIIGLSLGSVLPPDPIAIEAIGLGPGIGVAGLGVLVGAGLYRGAPRLVGATGCGCNGDCGCAD